jgi:uncharacterized membrane protein YphA (DoxX/SURF4 family)
VSSRLPPPVALIRAFLVLWWTSGGLLLYGGLVTARAQFAAARAGAPLDHPAAILGTLEVGAAALFLTPRWCRAGARALLAILVVALLVHAARGQFAASLLVDAAAVYFVLVHGPVSPSWARRRLVASAA